MKLHNLTKALSKLARRLDDDNLTVSFAYSNKKFFVSVSTHTSEKYEFNHGGFQRTVELTDNDFQRNVNDVISDLVNIYERLLIPKKENNDVS
jgi:hypothetical protein